MEPFRSLVGALLEHYLSRAGEFVGALQIREVNGPLRKLLQRRRISGINFILLKQSLNTYCISYFFIQTQTFRSYFSFVLYNIYRITWKIPVLRSRSRRESLHFPCWSWCWAKCKNFWILYYISKESRSRIRSCSHIILLSLSRSRFKMRRLRNTWKFLNLAKPFAGNIWVCNTPQFQSKFHCKNSRPSSGSGILSKPVNHPSTTFQRVPFLSHYM
jgi:hypothetical protein